MVELLLLFLCHFAGDFTHLSTDSMLNGKQNGDVAKIFLHASIHAILTGLVLLIFTFDLSVSFYSLCFMFMTHGVIDYLKWYISSKNEIFKDISNRSYWYIFGIDQYMHALTILYIYFNFLN